ncbi:Transcriptional regulator [Roseomonas mucosa]|uniref:Transcriptional regulator n=1 Tax=Roseomonas mucosa TaxID=207340 RepID=A0A4Y1MZD1_9PROT|nr:Transcriptional regulator [Roseomonas mucosa]
MTSNIHFLPDRGAGFVPERLTEARVARQMSRAELARAVNLTGQAIGYYEAGDRRPDMGVVLRFAEALGRTPSFFLHRPARPSGGKGTRFFRAAGRRTDRVNDALDARVGWLWEVVSFLIERVRLPLANLPEIPPSAGAHYRADEIEMAASQTRRHWGLGDGPIANMVALLETHGVIITRFNMGSEKIDAFSCWLAGRPFIVLGTDRRSASRSRFDAAHELGHLLLHREITQEDIETKTVRDRIEAEANAFAGAFLLPRTSMLKEFYSTRLSHLEGLKRRWRVSMQAIAHRAKQIGILDDDQYVNFRKQISAQKMLMVEPLDEELPLEQPKLLLKAWELILGKYGTRAEAELGLGPDMLEELCTITPLPTPAPAEPKLIHKR